MSKPFFYIVLLSIINFIEKQGDIILTPPTPHIEAKSGSIAKSVLLPDDPKLAKYIAEKYLNNSELISDVRGIQGYTGYYNGHKISVMASGLGIPSMGIYSYELFNAYDVQNIISIGYIDSINEDLSGANQYVETEYTCYD